MVCNISSKTIQTIIVTGCVLLCINVVPYRFVILFLHIFFININTTLDGWWHVRTTPLQCAYCCIILISHLLVDCCIYILQFNINWCIIVHAPTNIIRYERWPQAASTWQQWHKLRANVEQRSYEDKHAMGVLLVWVLLIVISWRCLFRRRLFIKFGGSYRVRRRRRWYCVHRMIGTTVTGRWYIMTDRRRCGCGCIGWIN